MAGPTPNSDIRPVTIGSPKTYVLERACLWEKCTYYCWCSSKTLNFIFILTRTISINKWKDTTKNITRKQKKLNHVWEKLLKPDCICHCFKVKYKCLWGWRKTHTVRKTSNTHWWWFCCWFWWLCRSYGCCCWCCSCDHLSNKKAWWCCCWRIKLRKNRKRICG